MHLVKYREGVAPAPDVRAVLADAVGAPTDEQLDRILHEVYSSSASTLYLMVDKGEAVLAVVGMKRTAVASAEILHIAVARGARKQGIGRRAIDELLRLEGLNEVAAETDSDAVNFYRRCGFTVQSLGEKYPGVERFLCSLKRPQATGPR
ncbi:MAG: GNAT family N-acetyltransferase [Symbiobacteriia bacterium]